MSKDQKAERINQMAARVEQWLENGQRMVPRVEALGEMHAQVLKNSEAGPQ